MPIMLMYHIFLVMFCFRMSKHELVLKQITNRKIVIAVLCERFGLFVLRCLKKVFIVRVMAFMFIVICFALRFFSVALVALMSSNDFLTRYVTRRGQRMYA